MLRTNNDLPEQTRTKLVALLNARLADGIDLMLQAKQAQWNVRGPHFIALHELFDKVEAEVEEYVELIAERAARFGGYVEATAQTASKRSALAECPASIVDGLAHVEALSWAIATFGGAARRAIGHAGKLGDADTADFFNEVSRAADELLWMVEAHIRASHDVRTGVPFLRRRPPPPPSAL